MPPSLLALTSPHPHPPPQNGFAATSGSVVIKARVVAPSSPRADILGPSPGISLPAAAGTTSSATSSGSLEYSLSTGGSPLVPAGSGSAGAGDFNPGAVDISLAAVPEHDHASAAPLRASGAFGAGAGTGAGARVPAGFGVPLPPGRGQAAPAVATQPPAVQPAVIPAQAPHRKAPSAVINAVAPTAPAAVSGERRGAGAVANTPVLAGGASGEGKPGGGRPPGTSSTAALGLAVIGQSPMKSARAAVCVAVCKLV